ncbi:MAG: carbohydrate ABC transporter permease [Christensenellales bacterium]|jgi:raffinose/stachyose/melibiose transport system permease protein
MRKKGFGRILGQFLILLFVLMEIYPILWIFFSSIKSTDEFALSASYALPKGFYYQNYIQAWNRGRMNIYFGNSAFVTSISLFFIVLFSVTASFALTKMRWKMRDKVMKLFLSGIMVPTAVVLIPLYTIYNYLGLLNRHLSLILTYVAFGMPLSVFLLRGYLTALPDDMLEAAVIDGAGIYKILWHIVLPLMKTGIVTVLVIQFYFRWNDLMFSMTFISDTAKKTVQTGLLYFSDQFSNRDWGAIFACIAIAVIPTLLLYVFLNKMVIEGMTAGAVKG